MPTIYGQERTNDEVVAFVRDYAARVASTPEDRFHTILSLVPADSRALDYGCGWGHYSVAMLEKGCDVTAIDLSQNEIDICRLVWGDRPALKFERTSIASLAAGSFDVVLSNQVIEHVHNVGNYLMGINRVLAQEGRLVVSVPNIANPRFFLAQYHADLEDRLIAQSARLLDSYDKTHDHINAWDPSHFVTLLSSAGFTLERYVPTEGVALPFGRTLHAHRSREGPTGAQLVVHDDLRVRKDT